MARYVLNRVLSGLLTLFMFVAIGFSNLQGVFAWNVLIAGAAAISIFCAGFCMISLGLKDVAFRGSDATKANRPG